MNLRDEQRARLDGLIERAPLESCVSLVFLASNGRQYGGAGFGIEQLDPVDKVDLTLYLIKHLGVTRAMIEEQGRLAGEVDVMSDAIVSATLYGARQLPASRTRVSWLFDTLFNKLYSAHPEVWPWLKERLEEYERLGA